jgi:integrase
MGALDNQTYVEPTKVTVAAFVANRWLPALDALVASGKLRASTVGQYRNLANAYIVPRIGRVMLRDLSADQLSRLYGALLTSGRCRGIVEGLSRTTVHAGHVCVHRVLRDAMRWGLVARNVSDVASEDAPRPVKREMSERVWSPAELRAFLTAVSDHRVFAAWILFATTRMRRGEACGLRWAEVDLEGGRLTISRSRVVMNHVVHDSTTKTAASTRMIGLDAATMRALRAHRAQQATERLA